MIDEWRTSSGASAKVKKAQVFELKLKVHRTQLNTSMQLISNTVCVTTVSSESTAAANFQVPLRAM